MADTRRKDYDWFIQQEDLRDYAGQWVAILNKVIIAHEHNIGKLISFLKSKYPGKKPTIAKIGVHRGVF